MLIFESKIQHSPMERFYSHCMVDSAIELVMLQLLGIISKTSKNEAASFNWKIRLIKMIKD